ncbi:MAG: hypothetical protein E7377_03275 [Clostridiales bacterium]|nr:hypothetical protein [Clostridiales bacterium]
MSKLGIAAALALVTTVGGVYAAWNYAEGTMGKITSTGKKVEITVADTNTPSGSIKFHNSLALWIDDEGTGKADVVDYTPGWDDYYAPGGEGAANAGELVIEFVPAAGATEVTLQYTLYIKADTNKYTDWIDGDPGNTQEVKIFNVADDANVLTGTFTYDFTEDIGADLGDGKLNGKVKWSYEDFIALFPVTNTFTVSTAAEYEHFAAAVGGIVIHADVEEVTP